MSRCGRAAARLLSRRPGRPVFALTRPPRSFLGPIKEYVNEFSRVKNPLQSKARIQALRA